MDTAPLLPSSIRDQFTREVVYLNTATCGLPPRVAHEATLAVERDRARGRLTLDIAHQAVERSRAAFASFVFSCFDSVSDFPMAPISCCVSDTSKLTHP